MKSNKGFTLVEVIVSIAIVGIIGIGATSYYTAKTNAKDIDQLITIYGELTEVESNYVTFTTKDSSLYIDCIKTGDEYVILTTYTKDNNPAGSR